MRKFIYAFNSFTLIIFTLSVVFNLLTYPGKEIMTPLAGLFIIISIIITAPYIYKKRKQD